MGALTWFFCCKLLCMTEKAVKRYVTLGTVLSANRRVQEYGFFRRDASSGTYLLSGKRLNKPTRVELEAAGRRALTSELAKRRA